MNNINKNRLLTAILLIIIFIPNFQYFIVFIKAESAASKNIRSSGTIIYPGEPESGSFQISSSNDNVWYHGDNGWRIEGYHYIGCDQPTYSMESVAYIWRDINIPRGATIESAIINLYGKDYQAGSFTEDLSIQGILETYQFSTRQDFDQRHNTQSLVYWNPGEWGDSFNWHPTPDISEIVQEIINKPDWNQGNDLALTIKSTTSNTNIDKQIYAYNQNANLSTTLYITWAYEGDPPSNTAPHASNLAIQPIYPITDDSLVASYVYSDPDGDPESGTEIRWYRNGALQGSFNDVLTIPSSATSVGDSWYFTVRPSDGTDFGSVQTSATVVIRDTLVLLRFESSHTLGANTDNGVYVSSICDMYFCWPWHSGVIEDMHSLNPKSKVIVYYDFMNIGSGTTFYEQALANNWILRNEEGEIIYAQSYPENKVADRGSPSYRQYVADWVKDQFQMGFDGVFADNAIQVYPPTAWTISERPVNPRTGQLYTDQEWFDDTKGFIDFIKNAVPEALMVCNGMLFNGRSFYRDQSLYEDYLATTNIDTVFVEGMFNNFGTMYSETDWKKSVDLIIWMQNNFLDDPSKALVHWSQAKSGIPADMTRDQMARFIFTSCLMGVSKSEQNYISLHGHMESASSQELFNIQLGVPMENYHIIQGTYVYERDFSKVMVLVNPTSAEYVVKLDGEYTDLDGNTMSSISMSAYTGTILMPVG